MSRINWDEYFMEMAKLSSKRSSCLSRQVGAVIVQDNRVVATGYNGSPSGFENCCDTDQCLRKNSESGENLGNCYAIHAEENAIIQCAKNGISCDGATLYVTTMPCSNCAKTIIQSGIARVIYLEDYNSKLTEELFKKSKVKVRKHK